MKRIGKFSLILGIVVIASIAIIVETIAFRPPFVSVVMPVYNREKLVSRAIDSILNQTYKNFEFIIVDDGSTDNTLPILRAYAAKDNRIKILKNPENKGISYSRQRGLDAAKGKYVAIMDSDDYSLPQRLERTVAFLEDYPDIDAVSGNVWEFSVDIPKIPQEKVRQIYRVQHDTGYLEVEILFNNIFQNTVALVRRDFIQKHNIRYDLSFQSAEDYDFWTQIVLSGGHLASLLDPLGWVRRHRENSESYYKDMIVNSIKIHKKAFETFFTPTQEDLKFRYNRWEYCSILEKMKNSDKPNLIPKEVIENRHALNRCPPTTKGTLFIQHTLWHDFLIPIEGKKYRRLFSGDTCQVDFGKDSLSVHWDRWGTEKFTKISPHTFDLKK